MDNLTHAAVGAAVAYVATHRRIGRRGALIGAWGATLPDLDVLIPGGAGDPLFRLEIHRHFTHSFAFAPFGAVIAALPFWLWPKWRKPMGVVYLAALLGYLTHLPIDAMTSYGTPLWLPFSRVRVAWDWIAIVDLFLTLPLVTLLLWALFRKSARVATAALAFTFAYYGFGAVQHARAIEAQAALAGTRGETVVRGRVFPVIGSLLIWRSVYETREAEREAFQADAIRVGVLGNASVKPGERATKLGPPPAWPSEWSDETRAIAERDLARFRFFADDYLVKLEEPLLGARDYRYSQEPETGRSMWGVSFAPASDDRPWVTRFERFGIRQVGKLLGMLGRAWSGEDSAYVEILQEKKNEP